MPELSLCMIVRDEEAMLPDFLAAAAGLCDEFIAVDTGSIDGTVGILEAAGARVVHFQWCDDFAAARNASLAEATGRWILFLDADERVSPRLAEQIRDLIADPKAGAATVTMRNEIPGGQHRQAPLLRLFRSDPAIEFEHRIHEDPSVSVQAMLEREHLVMRHLSGVVDHLGYVREVAAARDKKERDLALLRRSLEHSPDDFYCWFKILEIARFWEDNELWQETATDAAQRLDATPLLGWAELSGRHWSGEFVALISQGLFDEPTLAVQWMDDHAAAVRPSMAWHLRRGFNLEAAARTDEAEAAYRACLQLVNDQAAGQAAIRPLLGLCRLAAGRGDLDGAREFSRQAAMIGPLDPEALLAVAAFHAGADRGGLTDGALPDTLRNLLDVHPDSTAPLARALLTVGHTAAAVAGLRPTAGEDPEAALGLLVCTLILGQDVDLQVDVEQEEADELLKGWVLTLVASRQAAEIRAFVENSGAVAEVFPWLAEFLNGELGS
jgi:glycosyltransferase involved in cell wall biosynthesis